MKKKIFLIVMIMCSLLLVVGCDEEKENKETNNNSSKIKNEVVVTDDGVTIDGAKLKKVEVKITSSSVCNLSLIFDNSTDKVVKIDLSQIVIKINGEKYTLASKDVLELTANQSYLQWGLPFSNDGKINSGDTAEVYYGDTKIADAQAK